MPRKNDYNNDIYVIANRGTLEKLVNFIAKIRSFDDYIQTLPKYFVEMVKLINKMRAESAYETISIIVDNLEKEGINSSYKIDAWRSHIYLIGKLCDSVEIQKANTKYPFLKFIKRDWKTLSAEKISSQYNYIYEKRPFQQKDDHQEKRKGYLDLALEVYQNPRIFIVCSRISFNEDS